MRSTITRISCALAACTLLFTSTSQASAQPTPHQLTENATMAIARTTAVTATEINHVARSAIQAIHFLASEGAPPRVIHEAAYRHVIAINTLAGRGKAQTNQIAEMTIRALNQLDAPDPFKRTVAVANASSNALLTAAATRARAAITRALDNVLPDGEGTTNTLEPKNATTIGALAA